MDEMKNDAPRAENREGANPDNGQSQNRRHNGGRHRGRYGRNRRGHGFRKPGTEGQNGEMTSAAETETEEDTEGFSDGSIGDAEVPDTDGAGTE